MSFFLLFPFFMFLNSPVAAQFSVKTYAQPVASWENQQLAEEPPACAPVPVTAPVYLPVPQANPQPRTVHREEPACYNPPCHTVFPMVFASVDVAKGNVTVIGAVTEDTILVKYELSRKLYDENGVPLVITEYPDKSEYLGRGYIKTLDKNDVQFFNVAGTLLSFEDAAKELRIRKPVLYLPYTLLNDSKVWVSLKPDTLIVVDTLPDVLDIDSPNVKILPKGTVPVPPLFLASARINDGKIIGNYTVCKIVPETRMKELTYQVVKMVPEQRVKNVSNGRETKQELYTVHKPVWETCVKGIPYTVFKPVYETRQFTDGWLDIFDIKKLPEHLPAVRKGEILNPAYRPLFKDEIPVVNF